MGHIISLIFKTVRSYLKRFKYKAFIFYFILVALIVWGLVNNYFLLTNILVDRGFSITISRSSLDLLLFGGYGGLLCLVKYSSGHELSILLLLTFIMLIYLNLAVTVDPVVVRDLSHVTIRSFLSTTVSERDAAEIFKNLLF